MANYTQREERRAETALRLREDATSYRCFSLRHRDVGDGENSGRLRWAQERVLLRGPPADGVAVTMAPRPPRDTSAGGVRLRLRVAARRIRDCYDVCPTCGDVVDLCNMDEVVRHNKPRHTPEG
jgi:hypothetical protein